MYTSFYSVDIMRYISYGNFSTNTFCSYSRVLKCLNSKLIDTDYTKINLIVKYFTFKLKYDKLK